MSESKLLETLEKWLEQQIEWAEASRKKDLELAIMYSEKNDDICREYLDDGHWCAGYSRAMRNLLEKIK